MPTFWLRSTKMKHVRVQVDNSRSLCLDYSSWEVSFVQELKRKKSELKNIFQSYYPSEICTQQWTCRPYGRSSFNSLTRLCTGFHHGCTSWDMCLFLIHAMVCGMSGLPCVLGIQLLSSCCLLHPLETQSHLLRSLYPSRRWGRRGCWRLLRGCWCQAWK